VTARDGIGRPAPSSDLHDDAPTTIDPAVDESDVRVSGNGGPRYGARTEVGPRGSHASSKASTAYEVAAALRAQASRAAQATREAGRRVQDALSTQPDPGAVVANSVAKPVDTPTAAAAVVAAAAAPQTQRRHAPVGSADPANAGAAAPVGAAAAIAATAPAAPPRPRAEPSASTNSDTTTDAAEAQAGPAAGYPPDMQAEPAFEYRPETQSETAPASPGDAPNPPETELGLTPQSALTDLSDPAPAESDARYPVEELAPEAAALAPVVAPVLVPASEPGSLSQAGRGLVEPIETQVSLDARPEATQLAPHPVPRPATTIRRGGRVRKARLRLLRVDPWSVMKVAFLLSVALGITMFVAVAVLWSVLDAAGVFTAVGNLVRDLTGTGTNAGFQLENYTALSRVLGFTTLIAVIDVVLVTALATLGAFLYNLSASLLGGLEVTLAEDD
jgi:hypothetical protein